jgi:hypothetical protein
MTIACPCFGRNEHCRLCGGSGIVIASVEAEVARSRATGSYYSGQSDAQKKVDAAAKEAARRAASAPVKYKPSAAEETAAYMAADAQRRARLREDDEARRQEVADAYERKFVRGYGLRAEAEAKKVEQVSETPAEIAVRLLQEAERAAWKSAKILKAQRETELDAEVARNGPYRCTKCTWVNRISNAPCAACGSRDSYIKA